MNQGDDKDDVPTKALQMLRGKRWRTVAVLVSPEDMAGAADVVRTGYSDMGPGTYRVVALRGAGR